MHSGSIFLTIIIVTLFLLDIVEGVRLIWLTMYMCRCSTQMTEIIDRLLISRRYQLYR
jgi:hypothetical protein